VSGPRHGTLALSPSGAYTYTPAALYYGSDSFTFKANDGQLDSNVATVSITVTHVNHAPVAANGSATTAEDTPLTGSVTATDVDGDPLTFSAVTGPAHGSLTLNPNGSFTYTPAALYYGSDGFTFRASDGSLFSNTAAFAITVTHVNHAPVAANDAYAVTAGSTLTVAPAGVLANDTDVDGDPLAAQLVSGPAHGRLTLSPNGGFTYTPVAGYAGTDSFTYRASDGIASSNTATVSVTVNATSRPGVTLEPDPCDPSATALVIRGTPGDDTIDVKRTGNENQIEVTIRSDTFNLRNSYPVTFSRIIISGLAGNDVIRVQDRVTLPAWLFGGDGNDVLMAGGGPSLLVGGNGDDVLIGGRGRDVLIGGRGHDVLLGGGGDDVLIAGYTDFDANPAALGAIMNDWTSGLGYATRVANLGQWLNSTTVHDDGASDLLGGGDGQDLYFASVRGAADTRDWVLGRRAGNVVIDTTGW
jgi:VCBS repeat-containing protein